LLTVVSSTPIFLAAGNTSTADTTYLNASSQVKLEVAQLVIDNRASLATTLTAGLVTADGGSGYVDAVIETALAGHASKVADFNAIGALASASITATNAALTTYGYAPFTALSTTQKLAVSEEINKLTKSNGATPPVYTALDFGGTDAVTTLAQANAYIDAAIKKVLGN
jgi:hypothetical protein